MATVGIWKQFKMIGIAEPCTILTRLRLWIKLVTARGTSRGTGLRQVCMSSRGWFIHIGQSQKSQPQDTWLDKIVRL
eukprot:scaffold461157_cov34-Prasinocladus_malaysianus.AAC.1